MEKNLREQNQFIEKTDELKVTYIKKNKNNKYTIFVECSPGLFHKFIAQKKVFLLWERYQVYEDISIPRCFRCQEYYHKIGDCQNNTVCEYCAGQHEVNVCPKVHKKCWNCLSANEKYNTNYDINHECNNMGCSSYKYLLEVLKSKIKYH